MIIATISQIEHLFPTPSPIHRSYRQILIIQVGRLDFSFPSSSSSFFRFNYRRERGGGGCKQVRLWKNCRDEEFHRGNRALKGGNEERKGEKKWKRRERKKGKGREKKRNREREAWWDSSKLNDGERSNGTPSELPLLSLSVTHGPRRGCATIIYDAFFHYAFRSFSAFLPPRFSPSLSGFRAAATGPTHEPRLNGVASADGRFFHERRSIVSRFVNFTNERDW